MTFDILLLIFVIAGLFGGRVLPAAAAATLFAGSMLLFWLMGRPGITHINAPLAAALAVVALATADQRRHVVLGTLAGLAVLGVTLMSLRHVYMAHHHEGQRSEEVAAKACELPADRLLIMWGGGVFRERAVYRPTVPNGYVCNPKLYILSGLDYLPANLKMLHDYTHGKSLIQALLDGQPMYFLSPKARMEMLKLYLKQHYRVQLAIAPLITGDHMHGFQVEVQR